LERDIRKGRERSRCYLARARVSFSLLHRHFRPRWDPRKMISQPTFVNCIEVTGFRTDNLRPVISAWKKEKRKNGGKRDSKLISELAARSANDILISGKIFSICHLFLTESLSKDSPLCLYALARTLTLNIRKYVCMIHWVEWVDRWQAPRGILAEDPLTFGPVRFENSSVTLPDSSFTCIRMSSF